MRRCMKRNLNPHFNGVDFLFPYFAVIFSRFSRLPSLSFILVSFAFLFYLFFFSFPLVSFSSA